MMMRTRKNPASKTIRDQWIFVPFLTTVDVLQAAHGRGIVANEYLNTPKQLRPMFHSLDVEDGVLLLLLVI